MIDWVAVISKYKCSLSNGRWYDSLSYYGNLISLQILIQERNCTPILEFQPLNKFDHAYSWELNTLCLLVRFEVDSMPSNFCELIDLSLPLNFSCYSMGFLTSLLQQPCKTTSKDRFWFFFHLFFFLYSSEVFGFIKTVEMLF